MTYKTKKKIANLILMPVFGIWPKLGFYLRGRMIMKLGAKIRAIRTHFPEFSFWRAKLMNGGGSFCFLVGGKYVIKIAKNYDENSAVRLAHEKEITDMVRKISKVRVPKIEIFSANGYSFMKYDIIAGRNLNKIPLARLIAHREKLPDRAARKWNMAQRHREQYHRRSENDGSCRNHRLGIRAYRGERRHRPPDYRVPAIQSRR